MDKKAILKLLNDGDSTDATIALEVIGTWGHQEIITFLESYGYIPNYHYSYEETSYVIKCGYKLDISIEIEESKWLQIYMAKLRYLNYDKKE